MIFKSRRGFIRGVLGGVGAASLGVHGCKKSGNGSKAPENVRADKKMNDDSILGPKDEVTKSGATTKAAGRKDGDGDGPGYIKLEHEGELAKREKALWSMLEACKLCPRECGVNRLKGQAGVCSEKDSFKVASFGPHYGEERPLVGTGGSGTIFFSNCNLLCVYCQNWGIAHRGDGRERSHEQLARMMIALQKRGCHNINLVTPTHILPHIVKGLRLAVGMGLNLPIVYNTGGYDKAEVLKLLDGIVDIYMPDCKYQETKPSARYSRGASDYPKVAAAALKEMNRQVGDLRIVKGIAVRGLLIRHLVLPHGLAGTEKFVKWVASELGKNTAVNVMGQYRPMHKASDYPLISRAVTPKEYQEALKLAKKAGLRLI